MANTFDTDVRDIAFSNNFIRPFIDLLQSTVLSAQKLTTEWQQGTNMSQQTYQTAFGDASATEFMQDTSYPGSGTPDGRPTLNHLQVSQVMDMSASLLSNVGTAGNQNILGALTINGRSIF